MDFVVLVDNQVCGWGRDYTRVKQYAERRAIELGVAFSRTRSRVVVFSPKDTDYPNDACVMHVVTEGHVWGSTLHHVVRIAPLYLLDLPCEACGDGSHGRCEMCSEIYNEPPEAPFLPEPQPASTDSDSSNDDENYPVGNGYIGHARPRTKYSRPGRSR